MDYIEWPYKKKKKIVPVKKINGFLKKFKKKKPKQKKPKQKKKMPPIKIQITGEEVKRLREQEEKQKAEKKKKINEENKRIRAEQKKKKQNRINKKKKKINKIKKLIPKLDEDDKGWVKKFIPSVAVNGLLINFSLFCLLGTSFTWYSFLGYGIALWYIENNIVDFIRSLWKKKLT